MNKSNCEGFYLIFCPYYLMLLTKKQSILLSIHTNRYKIKPRKDWSIYILSNINNTLKNISKQNFRLCWDCKLVSDQFYEKSLWCGINFMWGGIFSIQSSANYGTLSSSFKQMWINKLYFATFFTLLYLFSSFSLRGNEKRDI